MNYQEFYIRLNKTEKGIVDFYKEFLAKHGFENILEVGSGWGIFTRSCIEFTKAKIITIDKIKGYGLPMFQEHTRGFEDRFERIEHDSQDLLPKLEDKYNGYFDLILVDADHTIGGASKDLSNSWKLLKSNGYMLVDDVFHKENWVPVVDGYNFGVTQALWGFILGNNVDIDHIKIIPVGHGVVLINKK